MNKDKNSGSIMKKAGIVKNTIPSIYVVYVATIIITNKEEGK
ncbi:MAG: hypothetical protein WBX01_17365 [Nitrososphaeraceae archaeon]